MTKELINKKLKKLAENFGTPVLVMDLDVIKENYEKLVKNVKNSRIYYAVKANSHVEILKLLRDLGSYFDVASKPEIEKLLSLGVEPYRMSFGNTIKKASDIVFAYENGIRMFAVDSEMELEKIASNAPSSDIYVRISTNGMEDDADWPLTRKFGTSVDHAIKLVKYASKLGLNPIGVSFHVGSQNYRPDNWQVAIREVSVIFEEAKRMGIDMYMVNTGGGMPVKYSKEIPLIEEICDVINKSIVEYIGEDTLVVLEPGRSMVGNAGAMVTSVILRSKKGDENWVYTDAGVFHGLTETIQNIKYEVEVIGKERESKCSFVLAGPTCDSVDVMYYDIELPESTTMDDLLVLYNTGAYTTEYSTNFNGIQSPKIVFEKLFVKEEMVEEV
ncbi:MULTISPECIES: type III PLP-dependent enzyme [unclassified Thermosipho (in: thermotogales)]|uniref:type III PLP-dependent enzyme n=1 Tax=unclassified Thermosipho (in: thermotogales) TaxID=2676525 RepID=UPI000985B102|nr:type III PLP-dependent enzyme [Thermosipho sp. 1223]